MNEWWRGAVIYQIYPRSFCDSSGDGVGDLPGIIDKLDYVARLGVDGIWISPFFPSPMKDFGYDVKDYGGVDPLFGTLQDFDLLLERAHELGLRVIIDQVYSHTSDLHPWFVESRSSRDNAKADWYVWADPKQDGTAPNNWLSIFGGVAWEWEPRRRQYYLHNFLKEQPDLNFHHPQVQDAVLAAVAFWLDRGVDGFRFDVANFFAHDAQLRDNPARPHSNPVKPYWLQRQLYNRSRPETLAFVARLRETLDRYPGTVAVAEIASDTPIETMAAYTDGPDRYHTAYSFVFLRKSFGADFIREAVEAMLIRSPTAWPSWAFSNHDVPRAVSRWDRGGDRAAFAKLLLSLLVSLRGTVFLYQGEELGLPQADVPFERLQDPEARAFWPVYHSRDGSRTPIPWRSDAPFCGFSTREPWLPLDRSHTALAVDRQEADPDSVLRFARRLLAWRRRCPALVRGDIRFLKLTDPVLAFCRHVDGDAVFCAFNISDRTVRVQLEFPTGDGGRVSLDPREEGDGPSIGRICSGHLELPPFGMFFTGAF